MPRGAAVAVFLAVTGVSSSALAEDPAACVDAADRGQRARKDGKLQDARDHFLSCSANVCPESVQKDCLRWANDTIDLVPSIVIDATDEDGRDIGDAKVTIDGYEVTNITEGRSITVDPGPHAIRVEKPGFYPVDQRIIAKEGMHARRVAAVLVSPRIEPTKEPARIAADKTKTPAWVFGMIGLGAATMTAGALILSGTTDMEKSEEKTVVRGLAWTSAAVGAGATIAGLFIYFAEPWKPRARNAAGITVTPIGAFGRF